MTTRITSEDVEPFAAMLVGRMWARVEEAKGDEHNVYSACMSFWWAVTGLEKIAIAVRSGLPHDNVDAIHFSIASSNHMSMAATLIKNLIGEDPTTERAWKV